MKFDVSNIICTDGGDLTGAWLQIRFDKNYTVTLLRMYHVQTDNTKIDRVELRFSDQSTQEVGLNKMGYNMYSEKMSEMVQNRE